MKEILLIVICLALYVGIQLGPLTAGSTGDGKQFNDKVNLALRQVGHKLLTAGGDNESTIAPVNQSAPWEFTLNLEQSFDYDTLPYLLDEALKAFNIDENYEVIVQNAEEQIPLLGYNQTAFKNKEVACRSRNEPDNFDSIVLRFDEPASPLAKIARLLSPLLLVCILGIIGFAIWRRKARPTPPLSSPTGDVLPLGAFAFDHQNQTLTLNGEEQSLTFRESKLLHYLARHSNTVLKRDTLIDEVWGDEGVIVGRSLDVFISRLRKLLKADEGIVIKSVHGVGYRMDVKT